MRVLWFWWVFQVGFVGFGFLMVNHGDVVVVVRFEFVWFWWVFYVGFVGLEFVRILMGGAVVVLLWCLVLGLFSFFFFLWSFLCGFCDCDVIFYVGFVRFLTVVLWCCYIWLCHGFVVYGGDVVAYCHIEVYVERREKKKKKVRKRVLRLMCENKKHG